MSTSSGSPPVDDSPNSTATQAGALAGVRVLDIGHGIAGPFGARLLGDLGADVIKVESPGDGDFVRRLEPMAAVDDAGTIGSLLFEYLNWNKRGITLDLSDPSSRPAFERLVRGADIVIDAFRPGRLTEWGFGWSVLREWNPAVVLTSVSNFGQTGELAQWQATDLIFYAMSGIMSFSGKQYPNSPLKHGLRQSLYCAGLNAAYASLAAHLLARATGEGEHVDLAIRDVMSSTLTTATSYYTFMGGISGRQPARQDPLSGDPLDTARGYVAIQTSRAAPPDRYAEFLDLPELDVPDWARPDVRVAHAEELRALFERRLATEDAIDLFLRANDAGLLVGLVQDAEMLLTNEQLVARDVFWTVPPRAPGASAPQWRYPAVLARLSGTPVSIRRPAPALGEHNDEVLHAEPSEPSDRAAVVEWFRGDRMSTERLPLAGLRVIDLSGIVAGPYICGLLSDLGADVIKIEGPQRPDTTRYAYGAFIDNDPRENPWDRGGAFQILNRGKRSLICDLATEAGQQILRRLLADADVLVENFRPRVLPKWGLTTEVLGEINPRLIVMSNSGFGATGPWRNFRAQGTTLELTMGIGFHTGYPGGRPSKAGQSYPDFIACWSGLTAILAALIERARSGQGQHIDQGMLQVGSALIPEALLNFQVNGTELARCGAQDLSSLASGVFESNESDSWVAVSIRDEHDLQQLATVVPGLADALSPLAAVPLVVQRALTEWLGTQPRAAAVEMLQRKGIPAGKVMDLRDLMLDPALAARGFYEEVDLDADGRRLIIGRPFRFTECEHRGLGPHAQSRAPHFGEHNRAVLSELAGLTDDEIDVLVAHGVVTTKPTKQPIAKPMDIPTMIAKGSFAGVDPDFRARLAARADPPSPEPWTQGQFAS